MTITQIMRIYGDKNQVIDSEYASDKAQMLAMSLYIKDLERKLSLEAEDFAEGDGGAEEIEIMSWRDFFGVVKQMRVAQRRYFKTRERDDLIRSKTLERAVDKSIAAREEKGEAR